MALVFQDKIHSKELLSEPSHLYKPHSTLLKVVVREDHLGIVFRLQETEAQVLAHYNNTHVTNLGLGWSLQGVLGEQEQQKLLVGKHRQSLLAPYMGVMSQH